MRSARNPLVLPSDPRSARNARTVSALAALALLGTAGPARAASVTWSGAAGDLNWGTPENWGGGALPVDIAVLGEAGLSAGAVLQTGADRTVNRLNFNFTSSNVAPLDFSVAGNALTLNGALNPTSGALVGLARQNTVSGTQSIDSNLRLAASQQWNVNGNSNASGGVGRLVINGVITDGDGGPKDLVKNGNAPLELNGDNTFTGSFTAQQNTVIVGHANALGLGTSTVLAGGTAANANSVNLQTKPGVTFARDVLVRSGSTGTFRLGGIGGNPAPTTWTGNIALNRSVTVTAGASSPNAVAVFAGNFSDASDPSNAFVSSNLTKADGGTVKFLGTNTYSGTTTVNNGRLVINGALAAPDGTPAALDAAVTVNSGARLAGTGTIDRPVTVATGGILSPGDSGPGLLTVADGRTVTFDDGAVYEWQPGPTPDASDRAAAGAFAFGPTVVLKLQGGSAVPDPGATYVLLSWSGADPGPLPAWAFDPTSPWTGSVAYVGEADGLPGGQVVASALTAVPTPEPGAAGLLVAVAGILLTSRRRRRG